MLESKHFTLKLLTNGVYACIHKPGGAAYSNAGIIDLGDRTLLVDTFDTLLAGRDLMHRNEFLRLMLYAAPYSILTPRF